jgi:hypothetical protein
MDVILELDMMVSHCAATKNRAGYFAALYKRMTAAVRLGIKKMLLKTRSAWSSLI